VFCGSNPGHEPRFLEAATRLGAEIGSRGLGLVFGGAKLGMMGAVADAALSSGSEVIGVIPEDLHRKGISHSGLTELVVLPSMHERKAYQAEIGDAFIAMPGGLGTLDEIAEILTWAQLGLHLKPCGLLNVNGYFDELLRFFDSSVGHGFLKPEHREMLFVHPEPDQLLNAFRGYQAPTVNKWFKK